MEVVAATLMSEDAGQFAGQLPVASLSAESFPAAATNRTPASPASWIVSHSGCE